MEFVIVDFHIKNIFALKFLLTEVRLDGRFTEGLSLLGGPPPGYGYPVSRPGALVVTVETSLLINCTSEKLPPEEFAYPVGVLNVIPAAVIFLPPGQAVPVTVPFAPWA
jgi:hypothetical protein